MSLEKQKVDLARLVAEAPRIAPSIHRYDQARNYGGVTDEELDTSSYLRWRIEAEALLEGLAASYGGVFDKLFKEYAEVKESARRFHSTSILVHKTMEILRSAAQLCDRVDQTTSTGGKMTPHQDQIKQWDVFICHAGEDKTAVVEPLANALHDRAIRVWFDKWVLNIGDSLRRKIDEGLTGSRYGVVILSRAFFGKGWPERELDGLVQREIDGEKVILPVWHGVSRDDVARYSPTLADKVAGSTSRGIANLADDLVQAIRPGSSRPPESIRAVETIDKLVDMNYPRDSGLIAEGEAAGYQFKWCFDTNLNRALDIEGWEFAYQSLPDGRRAILRMVDYPYNQTLIKKRRQ